MAEKSKGLIGVLTGGGDCPGLNAVIRGIVRQAEKLNYQVLGIKNGWGGVMNLKAEPLTRASVTGILPRGGNHPRHVADESIKVRGDQAGAG